MAAAFFGLAARLAGAFLVAVLAVDLRGAAFLAALVPAESAADTSVPAPASSDVAFLAEAREAARFGLAAAAVFADLRAVAFLAADFAGAFS